MFDHVLKRIASLDATQPAASLDSELGALFRDLATAPDARAASRIEERIWQHWMNHPDQAAAAMLERATQAIGANDLDTAAKLLDEIVDRHPDYAEAWNKRATLAFLRQRDTASTADIERTLALEPRHFGALCGLGQICMRQQRPDAAAFAFDAALRINPHLSAVRRAYEELLASLQTPRNGGRPGAARH